MILVNLCKYLRAEITSEGLAVWGGLVVSGAIAATWSATLCCSLSLHLSDSSPVAVVFWLLVRTFLHTGLFVIAHDAIHGNVLPKYPLANRWVGQLALALYGFLPYQVCYRLHWRHHAYPAQDKDPDFYPKPNGSVIGYFIRWYCNFMASYLTPWNLMMVITGVGITTFCFVVFLQAAIQNLVFFWVVPWVLSSLQLFTFGIFLPHYSDSPSNRPHQPRSYYYPLMCSLLACYHFSYHREHHTYPDIPWYQLPYVQLLEA
ncbi:MAG: fatty acid desaturase [Cyanobacteria bacterium P01_D01_bin.156]